MLAQIVSNFFLFNETRIEKSGIFINQSKFKDMKVLSVNKNAARVEILNKIEARIVPLTREQIEDIIRPIDTARGLVVNGVVSRHWFQKHGKKSSEQSLLYQQINDRRWLEEYGLKGGQPCYKVTTKENHESSMKRALDRKSNQ